MFGVQSLMPRLTAKIRAEARDQAIVVLYRFHLVEEKEEGEKEEGEGERRAERDDARVELLEAEDELSVYRVERRPRDV